MSAAESGEGFHASQGWLRAQCFSGSAERLPNLMVKQKTGGGASLSLGAWGLASTDVERTAAIDSRLGLPNPQQRKS
jgi:hypothetical protein